MKAILAARCSKQQHFKVLIELRLERILTLLASSVQKLNKI
jgi:hypothetical protein